MCVLKGDRRVKGLRGLRLSLYLRAVPTAPVCPSVRLTWSPAPAAGLRHDLETHSTINVKHLDPHIPTEKGSEECGEHVLRGGGTRVRVSGGSLLGSAVVEAEPERIYSSFELYAFVSLLNEPSSGLHLGLLPLLLGLCLLISG